MDVSLFRKLAERLDRSTEDMIELQRKLTATPALSPKNGGKGEWEKARIILDFLNAIGFDSIEECNAPDPETPEGTRPNIVAILHGENKERTIWIMAHMDVVPPGDLSLWKGDPYQLRVEGDKIFGRGVEDNQQGLVSAVFAFKALKEEDVIPPYNIGLVLVSDEETGSEYGIQYLCNNFDIFKREDLIIVPDAGNREGDMIEVAEKSILWIKFTTKGKQCHASTPGEGVNAFRAASHLLVRLEELHRIYDRIDPVFDPPESTFEPTMKQANVENINTIPGDDVFCIDCRVLPDFDLEKVIADIRDIVAGVEKDFGVTIEMAFPQREDAAPATAVDAPVVLALQTAVKEVYKVEAKPMGIGGGTVAAFFRRSGLSAAVWSRMEDTCHQPNEYCKIPYMVGDAKVFAHVFLQG